MAAPQQISVPATRNGEETTLTVMFIYDGPEAMAEGWAAQFVDSGHPEGETHVWTSYLGFNDNIFDNALEAGLFVYGAGRKGSYEMELRELKKIRSLAIRLGAVDGIATIVPDGPRGRLSALGV